jgi:undecaprenyl-phosphate alpha-N-acetylglucosaminyl 1-phosphatetransferase
VITLAVLFCIGLMLSGIAIHIAIPLAHQLGVVDRPGGHKLHEHSTPFVGGIGVFAALLGTLLAQNHFHTTTTLQWPALALGASVMFATGLIDDIRHLSFKVRFVVQFGVALVMVLGGGVILSDLGHLTFERTLELGLFAIPFTVFATVGVINALNMIDGIDGLSGSVALVSLLLLAGVAHSGGAWDYALLAAGSSAGVVGFLYFNLRFRSQRRARVFLGDNGSMLLGFLFAWMFIALSQEPLRVLSPVTALWLFAIPIMDTTGVMLRRLWLGKSPFRPDRHHLHHLFIRAGFRIQHIVYAIALVHLLLGALGLLGMWAGVHEFAMLAAFMAVFAGYFYLTARPWRVVPALRRLHTLLGLTSPDTRGVFLGNCPLNGARGMIADIKAAMDARDDYQLVVYETRREGRPDPYAFAILELLAEDNEATVEEIKRLVETLKRRLKGKREIRVRQYLIRNANNDPRVGNNNTARDLRNADRRSRHNKRLIHATHSL